MWLYRGYEGRTEGLYRDYIGGVQELHRGIRDM